MCWWYPVLVVSCAGGIMCWWCSCASPAVCGGVQEWSYIPVGGVYLTPANRFWVLGLQLASSILPQVPTPLLPRVPVWHMGKVYTVFVQYSYVYDLRHWSEISPHIPPISLLCPSSVPHSCAPSSQFLKATHSRESLAEAPGYAAAIATALRDSGSSHGSSPAAAKQGTLQGPLPSVV